jgi:flagellar biosynthesis GTPase FlhF
MKIVRHIAPDMRQAMRSIREQLGEDAVILSSRRIPEGVEVTAAVDFDATSLQGAMNAPAESLTAAPLPTHPAAASRVLAASRTPTASSHTAATHQAVPSHPAPHAVPGVPYGGLATAPASSPAYAQAPAPAYSHAATSHYFPVAPASDILPFAHILGQEQAQTSSPARVPVLAPTAAHAPAHPYVSAPAPANGAAPGMAYASSPAASAPATATAMPSVRQPLAPASNAAPARREPTPAGGFPTGDSLTDRSVALASRSVALNIVAPARQDLAAEAIAELPPTPAAPHAGDAMGTELKMMRRMLETQLAQLAWNDLTRRAPVHVEILRELTEIGISQELSEYILKQLPDKVELGFARRFAIAGLSQYLLVTGDRWLENGGRVAFIGATGVGKTTTLAKLAVRWVLRHGPRDIALVGSDTVRIGAQDQIQSLGQLLGVPVYTPENFESLPTLLARLGDRHRMILIDTPGSSLRDGQLASRLGVLSNCASQMETALVLAASTQAGAVEETVKRFGPANPACCVLTKVDEAASLGGALSVLIRARLPVSYVSEGQRVPEDLRPARALELVSTAVRLAKASGAAADEDLLRRRFGKAAHAIT